MLRFLFVLVIFIPLASCTAITDTTHYTFDVDPCPPRPAACTTGDRYTFVVSRLSVPTADASGLLDGFDLDGTDAVVCGQRDFVAPRGAPGIDNQFSGIAAFVEGTAMVDLNGIFEERITSGMALTIVTLEHVDDLVNDDCIDVAWSTGYATPGQVLDADGDGRLDANLTLDYGPELAHAESACVLDGYYEARVADGETGLMVLGDRVEGDRIRVRGHVTRAAVDDGLMGGSADVAMVLASLGLPPRSGFGTFVASQADLDPGADGSCQSISFALAAESVAVQLGMFRR